MTSVILSLCTFIFGMGVILLALSKSRRTEIEYEHNIRMFPWTVIRLANPAKISARSKKHFAISFRYQRPLARSNNAGDEFSLETEAIGDVTLDKGKSLVLQIKSLEANTPAAIVIFWKKPFQRFIRNIGIGLALIGLIQLFFQ